MSPAPARRRASALVALLTVVVSLLAVATGSDPAQAAAPEVMLPADVGTLLSPFAARVADSLRVAADATAIMTVAATPPEPEFHCPAPGAQFVDSWGFSRSGGRRHKGVDMMAPHGTPVIAPVDGTMRTSNSALGGLGFYLEAEDGTVYFGSHLQSLDAAGWVEAGTQIGTVGSTGNASPSGPHLHFEVHPGGGGAVNPYPFAAAWCR